MEKIKHYRHTIGTLFSGFGFSPRTDWAVALSVFLVLLIVISITSTLIFFRVSTESVDIASTSGNGIQMIDHDKLITITKYFKERSVTSLPDASVLVDPSR